MWKSGGFQLELALVRVFETMRLLYLQTPYQIFMETQRGKKPLWLSIIRWSARISSIFFICFAIFWIMAFHLKSFWILETSYMFPTVYTPLVLYIIGLLIAFRREGLGGSISLVFIAFGILFHRKDLVALAEEKEVMVILTWLMIFPSILYILSWYSCRRVER